MLHTWTRELAFHPHVHCVVTAGGLRLDGGKWIHRKGFLFAVGRLKACFRAKLLAGLDRLRKQGLSWDDDPASWPRLFRKLPKLANWVVYTEPPFGRSTHVLQYLGRYTHRVGLSDHRLVAVDDHGVTFRTRGEATLTLAPLELMRRYLRHVLPAGLNKIRHVGLYAAAHVRGDLQVARELLGQGDRTEPAAAPEVPSEPQMPQTWAELPTQLITIGAAPCPQCGQGQVLLQAMLPRSRAPPEDA